MTALLATVRDEALRWAYALSIDRWVAIAVDAALLVLAGALVFTVWRLVGTGIVLGSRPTTPRRENA